MRRGIFQPATLWWLACALLAVVFLPYLPWMTPDLSSRPEYQVDWTSVAVTPAPRGVPDRVVEEVRTHAQLPEHLSLLQPGLAKKLAQAFEAHPWIERVNRVEVKRQRRIEVDLTYRRVALVVETSRGFYPVDAASVLLPPTDFAPEDVHRLPVCRNVKTLPQGAAGEKWGDTVVECAARIADSIAPAGDIDRNWKRLGFAAILAPVPKVADPLPEDLSFDIATRGGSIIRWGRAPGADALEPSVDQKLERLGQLVQNQGSLDAPGGPFKIDIRYDVVSLQALDDARRVIVR
ncbi:cell division protein FtsQ/DivIB [Caulifigura coniformis]|uniref:hypothetical protein n=1 Tax=Caulifigura coniformis TaxID=2527983 RepID=UPI0011A60569|nr:hypothetical protein [Caulifigura coniformis]